MNRSGPGILLIGNYPPPFGGIPKHLQDLAPHLAREGWQVAVLSTGTTPDDTSDGVHVYRDRRGPLRRRAGTAAFLARTLPGGAFGRAGRLARLMPIRSWLSAMTRISLVARIARRQRIDVISAYNLLGGVPVGALAAEMFSIPLVATNLGEMFSHRAAVTAHRELIGYVTRRAARLLAPTQHCAGAYREIGLPAEVQVIHHGIHVDAYADLPPAGVARQTLGLRADAAVAAFVGRLVPDMGVQTVLGAAPGMLSARPDAAIVIAGANGPLFSAVRQAAAAWPGRIRVLVDVAEDMLPLVYAAASVVVVPTLGDRACGSLAAAEAMAAARPVVASAVGGIPEFVADGETGLLIPPGDPAALSGAVLALLADSARASGLGASGRRRARREFDREVTNREFEAVFRAVAGMPAR